MNTKKTLLSVVTAAAVAGALSMAYAQTEPAASPTAVEPHATQEATPMVPPSGDFTGSGSSGTTTATVEPPLQAPVAVINTPAPSYVAVDNTPVQAPVAVAPAPEPVAPAPVESSDTQTSMPAPQADRN